LTARDRGGRPAWEREPVQEHRLRRADAVRDRKRLHEIETVRAASFGVVQSPVPSTESQVGEAPIESRRLLDRDRDEAIVHPEPEAAVGLDLSVAGNYMPTRNASPTRRTTRPSVRILFREDA